MAALLAPDLLWVEVAQIGWKHIRKGFLNAADAEQVVFPMAAVPVERCPSNEFLPTAGELAIEYDRTVYDALYLTLTMRDNCPVITADARLVNALRRTPLASHLRLLAES